MAIVGCAVLVAIECTPLAHCDCLAKAVKRKRKARMKLVDLGCVSTFRTTNTTTTTSSIIWVFPPLSSEPTNVGQCLLVTNAIGRATEKSNAFTPVMAMMMMVVHQMIVGSMQHTIRNAVGKA